MIDLKSKGNREGEKDEEGSSSNTLYQGNSGSSFGISSEFDWNVTNEYDPVWPNEYEKVVKELRDMRDREHDQESDTRKKTKRDNSRFEEMSLVIFIFFFKVKCISKT